MGVVAQTYNTTMVEIPFVLIWGQSGLGLGMSRVCAIFRIAHGYKRKLHALLQVSDEFGRQRAVRSTIIRQWIYCLCRSIRTPLFVSLADLPALWSIE